MSKYGITASVKFFFMLPADASIANSLATPRYKLSQIYGASEGEKVHLYYCTEPLAVPFVFLLLKITTVENINLTQLF